MKAKPAQITVDWSRAKGLLADLKSHVRRSLAAQVLIGKELACLKKKLGFTRGGDRYGSNGPNPQCVGLVGKPGTWEELCKSELGISDQTATRWIRCFESATERAKARRNKARRENNADELITWELACRLLTIPADELDGKELEQLAECVGRIVDHDSQADLLDELGISKRPAGPPIGPKAKPDKDVSREERWAGYSVTAFCADIDEIRKTIRDIRNADELRVGIHKMPLTHPDQDKLTLYKMKGMLEDLFQGEVAGMLKFVEDEIKSRSAGKPPKSIRKPRAARKP